MIKKLNIKAHLHNIDNTIKSTHPSITYGKPTGTTALVRSLLAALPSKHLLVQPLLVILRALNAQRLQTLERPSRGERSSCLWWTVVFGNRGQSLRGPTLLLGNVNTRGTGQV